MSPWEKRLGAARRRHALRERAIAYMGGCCQLGGCGYNACHNALEFHHVDPGGKDFNISARMTSWKAIKRELDKCVLLCANHHREVHDGMHSGFLVLDGSDAGVIDLADDALDEDSRFPPALALGEDPFKGVKSLVDPNVTSEQIREAMKPRPGEFRDVTVEDLLKPCGE